MEGLLYTKSFQFCAFLNLTKLYLQHVFYHRPYKTNIRAFLAEAGTELNIKLYSSGNPIIKDVNIIENCPNVL